MKIISILVGLSLRLVFDNARADTNVGITIAAHYSFATLSGQGAALTQGMNSLTGIGRLR